MAQISTLWVPPCCQVQSKSQIPGPGSGPSSKGRLRAERRGPLGGKFTSCWPLMLGTLLGTYRWGSSAQGTYDGWGTSKVIHDPAFSKVFILRRNLRGPSWGQGTGQCEGQTGNSSTSLNSFLGRGEEGGWWGHVLARAADHR